ncbi:glycoside hydrolase family 3 C-terminal domain-containing protein [Terriglobus roseus]|uniref:glycoside hydrolase family 3 C-terminal domain-containing protein n=1 Tax=Terriglobus roseus TaxID=392734 RepID=UPI001FCD3C21|nr:glycoside hydrolase family 3 C-terminal domain-containing protein [Terriglobus roseus]
MLLASIGLLIGSTLTQAQTPAVCFSEQSQEAIDRSIDALIAKMSIAERIAQLQDRAPAIPRLNVPAYNWWNEGLHGLARNGYATVFPQAIGLAATWDAPLLKQVGDTVSTEARAKFNAREEKDSPRYGGLTMWSPNVNIFRDPRWGRGQETYGEDPYLTATLATGFVQGLQGADPFYRKADATPKHFAAHSGPEEGRDSFNAVVSPHDLADTYLHAFHVLTGQANAAALMCSYNEINGTPSCASATNLQSMVRQDWGFKGYVVSDCDAVGDISAYHHYAPDKAHAAAAALNAGVDLDCGKTYAALQQSLEQHLVSEATLNLSLHRLFLSRVRLGMMDAPSCSPYGQIATSEIDSAAHRALALRSAEESIVLLKNDGTLPLHAATERIAVIGPTADTLKVLEANYHGTARNPVTPFDALRSSFAHVEYAQGSLLAEGVSAPVPRDALRLNPNEDAARGLHAEYFNAGMPGGAPVEEATVERVEYDIDRVALTPALTSKQYSARWTGFLLPPASGQYVLRVNVERCWDCKTHDSFALYIDDKLVLDNRGEKADPDRVSLNFADQKSHALRLEYRHTGEDEGVALEWEPPASALLEQAVKTASKADAIVAFVGLSPDLEGEALQVKLKGFNGGDRTSLDLPEAQRTLLRQLQQTGKPLIVVLTSGSAVASGDEVEKAKAMLEAWYPGEAGGEAIANILSGKSNPSGRLPITFYRSVSDLPLFADYSMAHRTYRYFDGPVLYPFGFGLSYSRFRYGAVRLTSSTASSTTQITALVKVSNTGRVAGGEVAELYLQPPQQRGAPRLALEGVQRVTLQPGEERELSFILTPQQMGTVNDSGQRNLNAGRYRIYIGGSQPSLKTRNAGRSFQVKRTEALTP